MKRFYTLAQIVLLVFFCVLTSRADRLDNGWRAGQLTLQNDSIMTGELAYNWSAEIVMLRQASGCIRTFSARQVREFGWFDADLSKKRYFVSLTRPVTADKSEQGFYEVWLDGSLPVVRQLRRSRSMFRRSFERPVFYTDTRQLTQNPDQFDYFVYDDGQFWALDRFYTDIYAPLLARYDRELKQYVHIHNINDRSLLGRLVLIDRYNIMDRQNQQSASARTTGNGSE